MRTNIRNILINSRIIIMNFYTADLIAKQLHVDTIQRYSFRFIYNFYKTKDYSTGKIYCDFEYFITELSDATSNLFHVSNIRKTSIL